MSVVESMKLEVFAEILPTLIYRIENDAPGSQVFMGRSPLAGPVVFTVNPIVDEVIATSLCGFASEFKVVQLMSLDDPGEEESAMAAVKLAGGNWRITRHDAAEMTNESQRASYSASGVVFDLDAIPAGDGDLDAGRLEQKARETLVSMLSVPMGVSPRI